MFTFTRQFNARDGVARMREIEHWSGVGTVTVTVAESAGGTLATVDPWSNLVRGGVAPWPAPELLQKLYASERWRGKTDDDDRVVRATLGHYCDLQSLNSEDAITWSFIGPLIYAGQAERLSFATALLALLGFPAPRNVALWLWRRIPHPEKPASNGGPELDFGVLTDELLVLGEAKWNSGVGTGQGVGRDRSQLDLRRAYCDGIGIKAIPSAKDRLVLGVGRAADVFDAQVDPAGSPVPVRNISWHQLLPCLPDWLRSDCARYLAWKEKYSRKPRSPC